MRHGLVLFCFCTRTIRTPSEIPDLYESISMPYSQPLFWFSSRKFSRAAPRFMSSLSLLHLPLFALNLHQLHTLNDKYLTLLIIVVRVVQGRSTINSNIYFMKFPFHLTNTSYWSMKLKTKLSYLMEAILKINQFTLLMELLGVASLSKICKLKTK